MSEPPVEADPGWLAGYAAARAQAAALARLHEHELRRMAVDDAMLDPARHGGELSPEDAARSAELDIAMWRKAAASHAAEDIATAIEAMQPLAPAAP
jgi:hypothetical protein